MSEAGKNTAESSTASLLRDSWSTWGLPILLLVTLLVYLPSLRLGIVWDDHGLISTDTSDGVQGLLMGMFTDLWSSVKQDGERFSSGYFRPLMVLSLGVDRALFGESFWGYHLQNILWHLTVVGLLYGLLVRLFDWRRALLGASLFALHAVQSEVVFWIAARNDTIAAAFSLAAILVLWPHKASVPRLVLGGVLTGMAILGKESVLFLPLFLAMMYWSRGERVPWQNVAASGMGVGAALGGRVLSGVSAGALPDWNTLAFFLGRLHHVLALYFSLLVKPWPLSAVRSIEWLGTSPVIMATALLTLVTLAVGTARLSGRQRRLALLGLVVSVLSFVPALRALVMTGLIGERYLYFPMVGLGIWVAAVSTAWPRRTTGVTAALVLSSMALTNVRTPDWTDDDHFFQASVEATPNPYANTLWAQHFTKTDQSPAAFRMAARLYFDALNASPPNLGACGLVLPAMLKAGLYQPAAELVPWTLERGCPRNGSHVGQASQAMAMVGDWDGVRALLADAPPDPMKRDQVAQGALHQLDGDMAAYTALRDSWSDPDSFERQVNYLLQPR